jgi:hypothetical protein
MSRLRDMIREIFAMYGFGHHRRLQPVRIGHHQRTWSR